nr:MAG TPA: hypothetical protein [Caudoviricetes sp.]
MCKLKRFICPVRRFYMFHDRLYLKIVRQGL